MDSTAGDLNHAAKDLDEKVEEQTTHDFLGRTTGGEGISAKQELDQHSSSSSSQDVVALEKLDSKIVKVGEVKEGEEAYAHLPPKEKEIVKRQLDIPAVTVTFKTLYRYSTRNDLLIIFISAIAAIGGGAVMPLMTVRTCPCAKRCNQIKLLTCRRSFSVN